MVKALHSARYQRLCALLKVHRERAGLTQAAVAKRLKKPQSFVSKYETGERRLDLVEVMDVSDAIGVRPEALLRELRRI
jgi:transcriptional regulator with XRE-family HTH domain